MQSNRTIYFIPIVPGNGKSDTPIEFFTSAELSGLDPNNMVTKALEVFIEPIQDQAIRQGALEQDKELGNIDEYDFFDYDLAPLPKDILVCEIPTPGLLYAVRNVGPQEADDTYALLSMVKVLIKTNPDTYAPYQDFLNSLEAKFKSRPIFKYDVFISYAVKNSDVANELRQRLNKKGLQCFMAEKNISTGMVWRDEIRSALHSSRTVLLLLTHSSIKSAWVMCESGAFWALKKPIFTGYMSVDLKNNDIPEFITDFQCENIDSIKGREKLIDELVIFCKS